MILPVRTGCWDTVTSACRAAASTCAVLGLTSDRSPIVTVGTVSFPPATPRTIRAAAGSDQMFTSDTVRPARRNPSRSRAQKGHPGRQ